MDTYREGSQGGERARRAFMRLAHVFERFRHHPMFEEVFMTKDLHFAMREMERFLMEVCSRETAPRERRTSSQPKVKAAPSREA